MALAPALKLARVGCISEASYTKNNNNRGKKYEWCMTLSLMHPTNDNLSIKHKRLTSFDSFNFLKAYSVIAQSTNF